MQASSNFETLFLRSDGMPIEEIRSRLKDLVVQKQRWLVTHHPDSKVRVEALRASGVDVGEQVFLSIGLVVLDDYQPIVRIGDRVAFGNHVSLVAASAPNHSHLSNHPELIGTAIRTAPITIESDSWLGTGAIVLGGVTIGTHTVLGAGSVANRDIPSYVVAAGSPAKVIRPLSRL